jgi:hypothetical protein
MSETWLDQLVGEWTFQGHGVPDGPGRRRDGEETVTRRGAWIVIESSDDARFQLAFDPKTNTVVGDFISWAEPGLWTYKGAVEADGKLHLRSRGPSFDIEGEETDYDDVFEIVSPNERRLTGRLVGPDGQWRDFMVTDYRRRD